MSDHPTDHRYPRCVACDKLKPCYLFEISAMAPDDDEWTDTLGRISICAECVKESISQQTIVTALVESAGEL